MGSKKILVDAREFSHKRTGIERFIEGFVDALAESEVTDQVILACFSREFIPFKLTDKKNVKTKNIPTAFIQSEKALSDCSRRNINLFISPYPKLPFFGTFCPSINTIHDVLDLTHPAYKKRTRVLFDTFRLKSALKKADLTWYDSVSSKQATEALVGFAGKKPKVRHPGINEKFNYIDPENENSILQKYGLKGGYILVIGNGLPHKNLGVLLELSEKLTRQPVFIGVTQEYEGYWQSRYPNASCIWIRQVDDNDLPTLIRSAFCLAQPSTAEGYGYPPLEAMACGIPAVVSNIPVLVETTGGHSLTADPYRPETWREAFQTLENEKIYRAQVIRGLRWTESLKGRKGWTRHLSDIAVLLGRKKVKRNG